MHNLGLLLQPLTIGATDQGDGVVGLIATYGLEIFIGAVLLVVFMVAVAWCRRTQGNSRGSDKKF